MRDTATSARIKARRIGQARTLLRPLPEQLLSRSQRKELDRERCDEEFHVAPPDLPEVSPQPIAQA
jgi:hypothetical protein